MQVICLADSALEKIAGKSMCTRSGFVKLVWAYIKRNQLQKPGKGQGRWIIPNQEFAEFMGVEGQEINASTIVQNIETHLLLKGRLE
jgi:chromatin remodeling complex protein RSC6